MLKLCRYFDERMEALYRQGRLPGRDLLRTRPGGHARRRRAASRDPTTRSSPPIATCPPSSRRDSTSSASWRSSGDASTATCGAATATATSATGTATGRSTVMSHLPIAYPVACGAALAYKRRGEPRVAHGDLRRRLHLERPVARGAQHGPRSHQLPVVWVVNNNQYAYSTPNALEFTVPTIAERADAYGMPGVRVDGATCSRSSRAAREAVERARDGEGPTLIESVSLRWRGHAGHDPAKYMPDELLEEYMADKDPVQELRGACWRRASSPRRTSPTSRHGSRRSSTPGTSSRRPRRSPSRATHQGLWVEDGYWTSEPGRGGGTEAALMATTAPSKRAPPGTARSRAASAPRMARPPTSSRSPRRSGRRWSATSASTCSARTSASTAARSRSPRGSWSGSVPSA